MVVEERVDGGGDAVAPPLEADGREGGGGGLTSSLQKLKLKGAEDDAGGPHAVGHVGGGHVGGVVEAT